MENMIFIFGCGHSGTTILNKIISNHKNIHGLDYETGLFVRGKYKNKDLFDDTLKNLDEERKKFNKKWLCEKTPGHVYAINKIFELIKNPKIIIIVRDGRDVVSSLNKRYNNFEMSLNRWINDNSEWANSQYKYEFHVLKYENLVENPKLEIKKICDYLEEEYDINIFNYEKQKIELPKNIFDNQIDGENHEILRSYQINQHIYDGTKRYLKDLDEQQINLLYLNQKFMDLMNLFDYKI
jgi:hypothetical protein